MRHRHIAERRRQQLPASPTATAPVLDSTLPPPHLPPPPPPPAGALADADAAAPEHTLEVGVEWAIGQMRELLEKGAPAVHFYIMQSAKAVKRVLGGVKV